MDERQRAEEERINREAQQRIAQQQQEDMWREGARLAGIRQHELRREQQLAERQGSMYQQTETKEIRHTLHKMINGQISYTDFDQPGYNVELPLAMLSMQELISLKPTPSILITDSPRNVLEQQGYFLHYTLIAFSFPFNDPVPKVQKWARRGVIRELKDYQGNLAHISVSQAIRATIYDRNLPARDTPTVWAKAEVYLFNPSVIRLIYLFRALDKNDLESIRSLSNDLPQHHRQLVIDYSTMHNHEEALLMFQGMKGYSDSGSNTSWPYEDFVKQRQQQVLPTMPEKPASLAKVVDATPGCTLFATLIFIIPLLLILLAFLVGI